MYSLCLDFSPNSKLCKYIRIYVDRVNKIFKISYDKYQMQTESITIKQAIKHTRKEKQEENH